ncbi:MAG: HAMP domain-containing sensor histidine kinase [Isosphaeraceae bacterium]|nr:HAMP domain-containing sensor histidine kinase [Isosphaeraceae bacterium]
MTPLRPGEAVSRLVATLGGPGVMIGVFSLLSFVFGLIVLAREYNRPRETRRLAIQHVLNEWVRAPDYLGLTLVDYVDRWRGTPPPARDAERVRLSRALNALGEELQRQGERFALVRVVALNLRDEKGGTIASWSQSTGRTAANEELAERIPLIDPGHGVETVLVVRYRIDPGLAVAAGGLEASYHRLILAVLGLAGFSLLTFGYMILHAQSLSERVARESAQEATLDLADRTCHELGNGVFILSNERQNLANHLDLLDRFLAEEAQARTDAARKAGLSAELGSRLDHALEKEYAVRGIAPDLELRSSAAIARSVCRQIALCSEYIALTVRELDQFLKRSSPPVEITCVNVAASAEEALALLRPRLDSAEAAVDVSVETTLYVRADRRLLVHALVNLLKNALEATTGAGLAPRLVVAARSKGSTVWITVADNGPGISANAQVRIFEPGYSTKSAGRGRGLAIVKESILVQGGSIDVTSRPGEGAEFRITLPVAHCAGAPDHAEVGR